MFAQYQEHSNYTASSQMDSGPDKLLVAETSDADSFKVVWIRKAEAENNNDDEDNDEEEGDDYEDDHEDDGEDETDPTPGTKASPLELANCSRVWRWLLSREGYSMCCQSWYWGQCLVQMWTILEMA